jgi:PAS domain S-box-containing protein
MANNNPENRLRDLEDELNNLDSQAADQSLKKEKKFRKAIEDTLPSGIAVIDDMGKQVYVNRSFCDLVGLDEEELLGARPPYVYWAQQDMDNINKAMELTLNNNAPKEGFDLVFCHKSGKLIPVKVTIIPFIQEDGRTFWLANVMDVTEQKMKEEALKESQMLLRSSIESLKDTIVFSVDLNYKYMLFNRAHKDAMKFAYDKDIETGIDFLECVTKEENRKVLKENFDKAFSGESVSIVQTFGDIHIDYYEVFIDPIYNEKNEIVGCTSLARNITERKHMELELKESETKFKEIVDQINDGIIVYDEQGKIVIWNQGTEKISGVKAEDAIDKNIVDIRYQFTPPEIRDRTKIESRIKKMLKLQAPEAFNHIVDSEIITLTPPFRRIVQSNTFPIKLDGYNLFCAVIRDISETKRYEKELVRMSEDKDKFYSAIAQYLYTPFSTFHNFTKVMTVEMDSLPIRELQKMAVIMRKSAANLYSLLDNLLQWTKMNQGKISFRPENLDFISTSQDALSILKSNADIKNISINHHASEDITVFADVFMIKTILRNLVSHIIKCIKKDGEIRISAFQTPEDITVSVQDKSSALSADELTNLLNASEIYTAINTSEEKGTALGLLLSKEFIEKHGGKIWVENSNGEGTSIKFTLPASAETIKAIKS